MSGTLLAYGDKVIGVVAKDNGSVSITADGVKTYSALFDELYANVDRNKTTPNSMLSVGNQILCVANMTANDISFSRAYTGGSYAEISSAVLKTSSSLYRRMSMNTSGNTYNDNSSVVPSASTVITLTY